MRSCVSRLIGSDNINVNARTALFNMAVDIVNAFIAPLNKYLLCHAGKSADSFPHVAPQQGIDTRYFTTRVQGDANSSPPFAFDAIVASLLDEILGSNPLDIDNRPTLDACLRALEFVSKHQLDALFRSVSGDTYADKRDVAEATKHAVLLSEQRIGQAANLCQRAMPEQSAFTTPQAKRTSTFAFSASPPSVSSIGGPSVSPTASSMSTVSATKRSRPSSSRKLAKLQSAMERASKHLLD
ncbi:hypothetical protein H4R20_006138 [Coemansia guatemalensis]|uniref:Uncharacterized protein n=1 Tax=Coemansia guatemalensis TaxID=2761395 RepID=A0A9W8HNC4_9FUNG|nr:hypothetical protein H4R20_006138 [Coemansia guatemalensis]